MDTYRIVAKEIPCHHITDFVAGLSITPLENGCTQLIASFIDQSALRGLLDHLWDFNATILVVERIKSE